MRQLSQKEKDKTLLFNKRKSEAKINNIKSNLDKKKDDYKKKQAAYEELAKKLDSLNNPNPSGIDIVDSTSESAESQPNDNILPLEDSSSTVNADGSTVNKVLLAEPMPKID